MHAGQWLATSSNACVHPIGEFWNHLCWEKWMCPTHELVCPKKLHFAPHGPGTSSGSGSASAAAPGFPSCGGAAGAPGGGGGGGGGGGAPWSGAGGRWSSAGGAAGGVAGGASVGPFSVGQPTFMWRQHHTLARRGFVSSVFVQS